MHGLRIVGASSLVLVATLAVGQEATAPTPPPQFPQAPQPVAVAPAPSPELQLLWQKLAQRDALQQEIEALCEATRTPQQIVVRVQMLEVNLTGVRKHGIDMQWLHEGGGTTLNADSFGKSTVEFTVNSSAAAAKFVTALLESSVAKVLAEPTIATLSGRPCSFHAGGQIPVPAGPVGGQQVEYQKFGTEFDVLATALGNNRVQLQVRPRVAELDNANSIKVQGQEVPAIKVRQVDTGCELAFGETLVLTGLVQERVTVIRRALGRVEEVQEIALMVVVTPELVDRAAPQPRVGQVQPAAAESPVPYFSR